MVTVECLCPPTAAGEVRHPSGDSIELRERLGFAEGRAARYIVKLGKAEELSGPEIMTELTDWYIFAGVRTWTVVDDRNKSVEPNRATIRQYLFANDGARETVSNEADELYSEAVMAPLVVPAWKPSPHSSTNGSISATNGSTSKHPKPSKRSSTTTSPTGAIAGTSQSPAGASSSSPSSG